MSRSIDSIIDGFPHPTIPIIQGIPTYETLTELNIKLNANAASVYSDGGDGRNGLLILTVSATTYATVSQTPFVIPVNPGPAPIIPRGSLEIEITEHNRHFNRRTQIWKEYQSTDKALKQMIIGAVDQMYLRTLRHRMTGFANVTTRQLLQHVYTTYGTISDTALLENDKKMKTLYNTATPI